MEEERLLEAWVGLTGILKNSRLTSSLSYNESIILLLAYKKYKEEGNGELPVKSILETTKMLKSLVNRTLNSLEKKELITRKRDVNDSRRLSICLTDKGIREFMEVHSKSLELAGNVISIIGEDDARAIVRSYEKLVSTEAADERKLCH